MNTLWIDIAGWLGVALFLIAYALVSIRKLEGDSVVYQAMNILGGVFLITNSYYRYFTKTRRASDFGGVGGGGAPPPPPNRCYPPV
jgi:hypothetical protein